MKKYILFFILLLSLPVTGGTQDVHVGIFLNDIINVDLKTNTYTADFYLWFRWQGEHDPSETFEFVNAYEAWTHTVEKSFEKPQKKGGSLYQAFHVNGSFHAPFNLRAYPLDRQQLIFALEDRSLEHSQIRYITDENASSFRKDIIVPGWILFEQQEKSSPYTYPTTFGDLHGPTQQEQYSRYEYRVSIERDQKLYLFKMLLPIIIVFLCTLMIFFICPSYPDSRLAVAITALVSAVALHLTVSSELPSVGYLVLIDKIYNLCYFFIFIVLAETVLTIYLKDRQKLELSKKIDRWMFVSLSALFILSCSAIIYFR